MSAKIAVSYSDAYRGPFKLSVKPVYLELHCDSFSYPQCIIINCTVSIPFVLFPDPFLAGGTWMQVKRGNCLSIVSDNS